MVGVRTARVAGLCAVYDDVGEVVETGGAVPASPHATTTVDSNRVAYNKPHPVKTRMVAPYERYVLVLGACNGRKAETLSVVRGVRPVLSVDDALSEMAADRRRLVLEKAAQYPRTLITATDVEQVSGFFGSSTLYFRVDGGRATRWGGTPTLILFQRKKELSPAADYGRRSHLFSGPGIARWYVLPSRKRRRRWSPCRCGYGPR